MNLFSSFYSQRELRQRIAENYTRLYRIAYSWGHNGDLASDMAQETMLKALNKLDQLRDSKKLDSWLFGILVNCWRDHFRKLRDDLDITNLEIPDEDTPEKARQTQDLVESVRRCIKRLPEGQRQVVTLVNLEGFSYAEVAEILDIPVGTVMSRLSRARSILAERLISYKTNQDANPAKVRLRRIK